MWVADFGLARIEQDATLTMTGDILGTLRYMAPEQALARPVLIDHRADIYALGATLYELLTLKPVFEGKDREELLHQLAFQEPESLRKVNPTIPIDLETIILRTLEKHPGDRFESATDLSNELRRFLDDEPLSIRPVGPAGRAIRYWRQRPKHVAAFTAMLLVVVVSLLTVLGITLKSRTELAAAVESERQQKQNAAANLQLAKETVDRWYVQFANECFKDQEGIGTRQATGRTAPASGGFL